MSKRKKRGEKETNKNFLNDIIGGMLTVIYETH